MLTCPYCLPEDRKPIKNAAGLSMHILRGHPNKWRGSLKASLPPGYVLGQPIPAVARKGQKKVPIPMDCPAPRCTYHTDHPPAMANHIKGNHPEIWKDSLAVTLGRKVTKAGRAFLEMADMPKRRGKGRMIDPASLTPERARELAQRRMYEANRRKKFKRLGLSATGRPYKRQSTTLTLARPEIVEAKTVKVQIPAVMMINRCPDCGCRLGPHHAAAGIAARMKYEEAKALITQYETNQNDSQ